MKRLLFLGLMTMLVGLAFSPATLAETVGKAGVDISAAGSRARETAGGNLVADALKSSARADAGMVAADALTNVTLRAGDLTRDDLKSLLEDPDDTVATITLSGAQLRAVLERSVGAYPKPFDGFLQVSGITIEFNAAKASAPRITALSVNGVPVKPDAQYRVATLATLAHGGLGYFRMWGDGEISPSNVSALDALAAYVRDQKTVAPRVEGRIVAR